MATVSYTCNAWRARGQTSAVPAATVPFREGNLKTPTLRVHHMPSDATDTRTTSPALGGGSLVIRPTRLHLISQRQEQREATGGSNAQRSMKSPWVREVVNTNKGLCSLFFFFILFFFQYFNVTWTTWEVSISSLAITGSTSNDQAEDNETDKSNIGYRLRFTTSTG